MPACSANSKPGAWPPETIYSERLAGSGQRHSASHVPTTTIVTNLNHKRPEETTNRYLLTGNRPQVGVLEWFRLGDEAHVAHTLEALQELDVKHLRTGISWADWYTPRGEAWYDWLLPRLAKAGADLLPCVLYTPPSLGIEPKTSSPPQDPKAYADFLDLLLNRYGQYFDTVELWNEPNNRSEYDYTLDPDWQRFSEMIGNAAYWAQHNGKRVVLGGMSPLDPAWLNLVLGRGLTPYVDVVGLHGFPDVFDAHFEPWDVQLARLQAVLDQHGSKAQVWITEAGFSTWQYDERKQAEVFTQLLQAPVERFYWYGLHDLAQHNPTVDGFHLDEREYHFGMRRSIDKGRQPKLLYRAWASQGAHGVSNVLSLTEGQPDTVPVQMPGSYSPLSLGERVEVRENGNGHHQPEPVGYHTNANGKYALVTGGAGFIGTNLVARLLDEGQEVLVMDNLSRVGVDRNLAWLKHRYKDGLRVLLGDIRNPHAVRHAVQDAHSVYHLAAQVAVTTSLTQPDDDFAINLMGTQHVLEALRKRTSPAPLVFTSTNKVYGDLHDVQLYDQGDSYSPTDGRIRRYGISEQRPLNFHSPYGCSKGAADQYVLDYARTLGIPGVVFRMSCIYGYHQQGNEDQGWVAHFLIRALQGQSVTLYGDGMQVRDLLFADDLVNAFRLAQQHMDTLSGQAFNIGGGVSNSLSIKQVVNLIGQLHPDGFPAIHKGPWRAGDQKYYVSDTAKFQQATGWRPAVSARDGIQRLYNWLLPQFPKTQPVRTAASTGTTSIALAS